MIYVICEPCDHTKDRSCVEACPVHCIYELEHQLVINAADCVGCAACVPACPVSAIFSVDEVPSQWTKYIALGQDLPPEARHASPPALSFAAPTRALPRPLRVGVVGAGPAGFYLAQSLLKAPINVSIDLIERLPTPYGLVRYGVAPDHPEVKSKGLRFEQILSDPAVRLLGHVEFGKDLTYAEAKQAYDVIAYTYGAKKTRELGIPGEQLEGCISASSFVAWYNGHPDGASLKPALDAASVVIIGLGNVTLDVARMLVMPHEALRRTDIASHALEQLKRSKVREIHIVGRDGPSQANFTSRELRDLSEVPGVEIYVDPEDLKRDRPLAINDQAQAQRVRENLELFASFTQHHKPARQITHRVYLHFFESPVEVLGTSNVDAVRLEANELIVDKGELKIRGTGQYRQLPCKLMLKSIGYRSVPIEGVCFDASRGVIPNVGGRVVDEGGQPILGEYASGWCRRGATGIIGTNKKDAEEVAAHILSDLGALPLCSSPEQEFVDVLLQSKGVRVVDATMWRLLAREERTTGSMDGRRAQKVVDVERMLEVIDHALTLKR